MQVDTTLASPSQANEVPPSPSSSSGIDSPLSASNKKFKREDLQMLQSLGWGSYSKVMLAEHVPTGNRYAVKIVSKAHMIQEKKVHYVMNERNILRSLNHPNIIRLISTFQTQDELFFVIDYCEQGELLKHIQEVGGFDVKTTRHMAAEVVNALAYLREKKVIHRDLKPENILVDKNNHLKLVDFGTAIESDSEPEPLQDTPVAESRLEEREDGEVEELNKDHSKSFCGTAQYASPELLTNCTTTYSSDLWALGCIIYQMLTAKRPFQDPSDYLTFKRILELDITYHEDFPELAKDLCERLLVLDPSKRLGVGPDGIVQLKAHPFFEGIDFDNLHSQALDYSWRAKAPVWVKDCEATHCMDNGCKKEFGLFVRKHHCRACGKVFCRHCSQKAAIMPNLGYDKPVRVCDTCHAKLPASSTTLSPSRSGVSDDSSFRSDQSDPLAL